jgi:hypothetical protein
MCAEEEACEYTDPDECDVEMDDDEYGDDPDEVEVGEEPMEPRGAGAESRGFIFCL